MQTAQWVSSAALGIRSSCRVHPADRLTKRMKARAFSNNTPFYAHLSVYTTIVYTALALGDVIRQQVALDAGTKTEVQEISSQYAVAAGIFGMFAIIDVLDMALPSAISWESPSLGITLNSFCIRYGAMFSYILRASGAVQPGAVPVDQWRWPPLYSLEWAYTTFHMILLLCYLARIELHPAIRLALTQVGVVIFGALAWSAGESEGIRWASFAVAMLLGVVTAAGVAVAFDSLSNRCNDQQLQQKIIVIACLTAVLCSIYPFTFVLEATGAIDLSAREVINTVCDLNCKILLTGVLAQMYASKETQSLLEAARQQNREVRLKREFLLALQEGIKFPMQSALSVAEYTRSSARRTQLALRDTHQAIATRLSPVVESCGALESRLYQMRKVLDNGKLLILVA